jgi:hypothetical protein
MTQHSTFRSDRGRDLVHPNAPAGGSGPGPSRKVGIMRAPAGPTPHAASPAARYAWTGSMDAGRNALAVVHDFQKRIEKAKSLQELMAVAAEIARSREALARRKAITTPQPGDQAVKEVLTSIVTDQMGALQKIALAAGTELVEAGASAATAKACAEAFAEAIDAFIEQWLGKFSKELRGAIEKRDVESIVKACAEGATALAAGLKDGNSLVRTTLQILKGRGINVGEAALAKWVFGRLESFGTVLGQMARMWTAHPLIIAARLLLTPSNIAGDSEVLFLAYKDLGDQLQARTREFVPPLEPMRAVDRLRLPAGNGPVLRAP